MAFFVRASLSEADVMGLVRRASEFTVEEDTLVVGTSEGFLATSNVQSCSILGCKLSVEDDLTSETSGYAVIDGTHIGLNCRVAQSSNAFLPSSGVRAAYEQ